MNLEPMYIFRYKGYGRKAAFHVHKTESTLPLPCAWTVSPLPLPSAPAPPCCPGEMQGPLA